ncbi:MAG: hypothetical protein A3G27_17915 [Betaproteobacteria bacterium RIFCSPLOWO2_12_FULL_66_14]|nr:MAG: hypothetical protein A3G27_17915 [Betaproteobacteria bacterium RIFCSPLOWO2_12_FULL_66_14]
MVFFHIDFVFWMPPTAVVCTAPVGAFEQCYPAKPISTIMTVLGPARWHVVAAYNVQDDETIVITVYEPEPSLWEDGFNSRLKPSKPSNRRT